MNLLSNAPEGSVQSEYTPNFCIETGLFARLGKGKSGRMVRVGWSLCVYTQGLRRDRLHFLVYLAAYIALALQLGAAVSPEFAGRRASLRKSIPDGVLVLFGSKESDDLHES